MVLFILIGHIVEFCPLILIAVTLIFLRQKSTDNLGQRYHRLSDLAYIYDPLLSKVAVSIGPSYGGLFKPSMKLEIFEIGGIRSEPTIWPIENPSFAIDFAGLDDKRLHELNLYFDSEDDGAPFAIFTGSAIYWLI